jgi:hypothetical protein
MISLAVDFTAKTLSHLPDFFADRVTASFDDSPQTFRPGDVPIRLGMHVIGASSAEIAFRDGREREDPGIKKAKKPRPSSLVSWGEFGPILSTVLTDATKGRLEWSHWEQGSADPVAVFRFAVTRKASNYMVNYCCIQVLDEPTPFAGGDVISNDSLTSTAFHQMVAYHGTLSLDPATGTISRLVIQADLKPSDPIEGADIVVEYGKVRIGDKVFTCPVKSVSLARVPVAASAYPNVKSRLMLNDVAFRNYHHFEATVRILPDQVPSATAIETLKDPPEKDAALASATSGTVPSREETTPSTIFNPAPQSAASAPSEQSNETTMPMIGATRPPSTSPGDGIPETSSESATPFPQGEPEPGSITLRVISRLVNADIVAYDKNNHPVRDLKAEDFEVYDNGKKQKIRFFSAPAGSLPVATSASQPLQSTFSNGADQATRQSASARDSVCTILLID